MSETIKVCPATLSGEVDIIPSKSYIHRYLIAAALADEPTEIIALTDADDVRRTAACMNALGAKISYKDGKFKVIPISTPNRKAVLDCHESGTTLRFIIPVAAALGTTAEIRVSGRLATRPIKALLDCLAEHDVTASNSFPLKISGKLTSGGFRITGSVSSQYISGLLLALPLLDGGSRIIIENTLESKDYVEITVAVLKKFGIQVEELDNGYLIKGGQKYVSPGTIKAEGDWSNAAFFAVAGAIGGDIKINGLDPYCKQGDKAIVDVLKSAKAWHTMIDGTLHVKKSPLIAFEMDAKDTPDMVPVVSVLAACSAGTSIIKNVQRLRDKESDRLDAVINTLTALGINAASDGETLMVEGGDFRGDATLQGVNDHRMVMAAAVACLAASSACTITDPRAIKKSYPNFFEEFKRLGGSVERQEATE
jgi:3-phosphoshikimate 1-carboxyvinyltransferase